MHKKFTLLVFISLILLAGCSKDFLKKYDKRIIGQWHISDIDRHGFGGDIAYLPFQEGGNFDFRDGGVLIYTDDNNHTYNGSWDIIKKHIDQETIRSLEISVNDFVNQQTLFENYDDMNFVGTDHFKAKSFSGLHTYVTHFRR